MVQKNFKNFFTKQNIDISKLPADVRKTFKQMQVLLAEKKIQSKAKNDFLSFVKCVWPEFVEGSHHRHIAEKFNKLATGEITRLIVNMPPRHTKSEFASYLLPAWMVGRNPKLKIIQACLLYTSPSPRDRQKSRMPSSA